MPKDENHRSQADRYPQDGKRLSRDSLRAAVAYLGGNDGSSGEKPFGVRRKIAVAERSALIRWCEDNSLVFPDAYWEPIVAIGGSEHDIWADNGRMWKVTRPDRFGWTVLPGERGVPEISEATPLEYLNRWLYSNSIFGDSVTFEGIFLSDEGVQVIVSQDFIVGSNPTPSIISQEMDRRGFELIPGFSIGSEPDSSFYSISENIAVFDAVPDNFILSLGMPIPVDVIPVMAGPLLKSQILKLMA